MLSPRGHHKSKNDFPVFFWNPQGFSLKIRFISFRTSQSAFLAFWRIHLALLFDFWFTLTSISVRNRVHNARYMIATTPLRTLLCGSSDQTDVEGWKGEKEKGDSENSGRLARCFLHIFVNLLLETKAVFLRLPCLRSPSLFLRHRSNVVAKVSGYDVIDCANPELDPRRGRKGGRGRRSGKARVVGQTAGMT